MNKIITYTYLLMSSLLVADASSNNPIDHSNENSLYQENSLTEDIILKNRPDDSEEEIELKQRLQSDTDDSSLSSDTSENQQDCLFEPDEESENYDSESSTESSELLPLSDYSDSSESSDYCEEISAEEYKRILDQKSANSKKN